MINQIFKRSAVALCAAAFAALVPLASAGPASAQMRPHPTVHRAGAPMHGAMMRPGGRWMHAGATFRGRHFVSTRRSFGGRVVVANRGFVGNRGFVVRRYGWRGHPRRFFAVGGYPYYAYGYGYRRHSCWWYRRFDPWNMPSWCGVYGYSYGYEPSYAYGYGPAFGWRHRHGTFGHRHFAFGGVGVRPGRQFGFGGARPTRQFASGGARARPMEGRAALVGGQGARFQGGGPRNFGGGGAHFGGGAHMGGPAHVGTPGGGHVIQH